MDIITVKAKPLTNSILGPSPVTIGKNANIVVPVAAVRGITRCFTDSLIESFIERPIFLLCL